MVQWNQSPFKLRKRSLPKARGLTNKKENNKGLLFGRKKKWRRVIFSHGNDNGSKRLGYYTGEQIKGMEFMLQAWAKWEDIGENAATSAVCLFQADPSTLQVSTTINRTDTTKASKSFFSFLIQIWNKHFFHFRKQNLILKKSSLF